MFPLRTDPMALAGSLNAARVPVNARKPGLLDQIFGMGGQDAGLFGQDVTKRAGQMGLLNAGLTMLAAGGRQPNRTMYGPRPNLGQALLQSLQAGQQGYQQVLGGASDLGAMRAQQEEAVKAQRLEQAREMLMAKYGEAIGSTDPAVSKPAIRQLMTEAASLGIKDILGPFSNVYNTPDGAAEKEPKYVQMDYIDPQTGKHVQRTMTAEQAAAMGPVQAYDRPMGGGGSMGGLSPAGLARAEQWVSAGFDRDVKPDMEIINRYDQLSQTASALGASGPVQVGALFSFITQLDDTAVRDGERDLVTKAASLKDQIAAIRKKYADGEQVAIPPQMYKDIMAFLQMGRRFAATRVNQKREAWQKRGERLTGMSDDEGVLTPVRGDVLFGDVEGGAFSENPYR